MGYHPRIESKTLRNFLTTRSRNSELWFVNNLGLEKAVLGYAAKYSNRHNVKLYALAIEGNHIQAPAHFPEANRSDFMRDFNSNVARAVPRYAPSYSGGRFWGKRYSGEYLPGADDIEEYFFYTVLQPVKDGLVERISDYPGYNCFHDAVHGIERQFKVVRWGEYRTRKRYNSKISIDDFTDIVVLKYQRLPGYEHLPQAQYAKLMKDKLEQRRSAIVAERYSKGLGFMGRARLLKVVPGSRPRNSKTSTIDSHRPRILAVCAKRRAKWKAWYFEVYFEYKEASELYRSGQLDAVFPQGTYRPYCSYHQPSP